MKTSLCSFALLALVMIGCNQTNQSAQSGTEARDDETVIMDGAPPTAEEDQDAHDHAEHDHPEHGPHEGELVELGRGAFHVEIVHDEGTVAFYVLDEAAAQAVAIPASVLTVSLKHEGEVRSFELEAEPQADDPEGLSSRFTSGIAKLVQWLDAGAEGAVTVQIDGKSLTGNIEHHHDHAGHEH